MTLLYFMIGLLTAILALTVIESDSMKSERIEKIYEDMANKLHVSHTSAMLIMVFLIVLIWPHFILSVIIAIFRRILK